MRLRQNDAFSSEEIEHLDGDLSLCHTSSAVAEADFVMKPPRQLFNGDSGKGPVNGNKPTF